MNSYIAVALGGAIGATLRFAVSEWIGNPQGTLVVNAVGSLSARSLYGCIGK